MKLAVFDVEGTLFRTTVRLPGTQLDSTIWQALALSLGEEAVAEEVETHRKWAQGSYRSYLDWMRDTIAIHQHHRLTGTTFRRVVSAAEYNPAVLDTLRKLDRSKYEPVLVSGGFRELAARAQADLGINHAFAACEYLFSSDDLLAAFNLLPCDFRGKIDFIMLMLREYGLTDTDWLFIGDGLNDVPIAKAAPLSIGYRPHPSLRNAVTHSIDDFSEILRYLP